MIAGRLQFLAAMLQRLVDLVRFLQRRAKHWLGDAVKVRIERVEKNDAQISKHARVETGKARAKCLALAIAGRQHFADLGTAKQSFYLSYCRVELITQNHRSHP